MPVIPNGVLGTADFYGIDAIRRLDPLVQNQLGQYMTPPPIAEYMASLFGLGSGEICVLDPGAGVGALTAAFIDRFVKRNTGKTSIALHCYEIDTTLIEYLKSTLRQIRELGRNSKVPITGQIHAQDFVHATVNAWGGGHGRKKFTHVIMNPPYKKIKSSHPHRAALRKIGLETSNLYTAFLYLAALHLTEAGEMVAIVPRSFCNGPYFSHFRKKFFEMMSITHVHVFKRRDQAFRNDNVLQENIILHAVKSGRCKRVVVSTSHGAQFCSDSKSGEPTTVDLTHRLMDYHELLHPQDVGMVIHLKGTDQEQAVAESLSRFEASLNDLDVQVSTGPVVGYRVRDYLCAKHKRNSVPLLYPAHFQQGALRWPTTRKPNAIALTDATRKWLFPNKGHYVVTRRFSAKEERRRIVAAVYSSELPADLIGFENHLNVYHAGRNGFAGDLARGLCIYLNSTLVDLYFRQFSGHTQVNATDLRALTYPNRLVLERIGKLTEGKQLSQEIIDTLITEEIGPMAVNPVRIQQKIEGAIRILKDLGLPSEQQNERSALTLLALCNLPPQSEWLDAGNPLIGITPIIDYCRDHYGTSYAPNTRETFRRQTMHQFVQAGLVLHNPDDPSRAVNSPKTCYQIAPLALKVVQAYGTDVWETELAEYLKDREKLVDRWAKDRKMEMIPVSIPGGQEISLTPGRHSKLIKDVIKEFAPRFAPGAEVIYIGDAGKKMGYFNKELLHGLGVVVDEHGKMPDVVLYFGKRNWLFLIESVTSHGPVDAKRQEELKTVFGEVHCGIVYVTVFPDRSTMAKHLASISWETEVWCADSLTHLIHFDGERFLGPYGD